MRHMELREMLMWMCSRSAANSIHLCDECYLFEVGTSKKNTFAMLGVRLTRRTTNKPLFGICSDSTQSRMPRLHLRTNVDIPLHIWLYLNEFLRYNFCFWLIWELLNHRIPSFFFMHCTPVWWCEGSVTLCHPLYKRNSRKNYTEL